MTRKYNTSIFGKDFEFELTPEVLAYEMSMEFSNQIINLCAEKDISMGELAEMLNISPSTLSEKLNGQNLTLKSMAAMALALDCDAKAPELIPQNAQASEIGVPATITIDNTHTSSPSTEREDYKDMRNNRVTRSRISPRNKARSFAPRKQTGQTGRYLNLMEAA